MADLDLLIGGDGHLYHLKDQDLGLHENTGTNNCAWRWNIKFKQQIEKTNPHKFK